MIRHLLLAASVLLSLFNAAEAAKTFTITVAAGDYDRKDTPVVVDVPGLTDLPAVALEDAQGNAVQVQATVPKLLAKSAKGVQVVFIVHALKKGESAKYKLTELSKPAKYMGSAFTEVDEANESMEIVYGEPEAFRPVLKFMCKPLDESTPATREQTYKVFHHVFDPEDGKKVVTKGPGGQFTHHRGLYFGFNKVFYNEGKTKCDIWHCRGAHQAFDSLVNLSMGPVMGRQRLKIGWFGPEQERFADETREVSTFAVPKGTLIEFASRVETKVGPIALDGDPQHAGFHFRADNEVSEKTKAQTYYLRPDGKDQPGKTRNWDAKTRNAQSVNLPWNAMSFVLGDQRYTAVYLDHPQNPKEARYSERDYGRFGSYFEYEIREGKPLEVNYRVWLQRGELTGEQAEAIGRDFVNPPEVTVVESR